MFEISPARRSRGRLLLSLFAGGAILLAFGSFRWHRARRQQQEEDLGAATRRVLVALVGRNTETALAETAGLGIADLKVVADIASSTWTPEISITSVRLSQESSDASVVKGEILLRNGGKVRFHTKHRLFAGRWKLETLTVEDVTYLPWPPAAEGGDEISIPAIRVAGRKETAEGWALEFDIDVIAEGRMNGRWIERTSMLRPRVVDPRGEVHDSYGGVNSLWQEDPSAPALKTLRQPLFLRREWGPGKYRVTWTMDRYRGHSTSREIDVEVP